MTGATRERDEVNKQRKPERLTNRLYDEIEGFEAFDQTLKSSEKIDWPPGVSFPAFKGLEDGCAVPLDVVNG